MILEVFFYLKTMKPINECRICKNKNLKKIINLGNFSFTGIFPKKIIKKLVKEFFNYLNVMEEVIKYVV